MSSKSYCSKNRFSIIKSAQCRPTVMSPLLDWRGVYLIGFSQGRNFGLKSGGTNSEG